VADKKQGWNKQEWINEYSKQDKRLQSSAVQRELIANDAGISLERTAKIGRGVREIHDVQIFGDTVPMRVLSMDEERRLRHATHIDMKAYPEFDKQSNEFAIEFNKQLLRKMVSLSTSPCPEYVSDEMRFFTERDIGALPATTFAELINIYRTFELEYNPDVNQIDEKEVLTLIGELRDPEKKSALIRGMTFSQRGAVLSRLLEIDTEQEDNSHLSSLLNDSNLDKKTELP
jgi:hypothetical protein